MQLGSGPHWGNPGVPRGRRGCSCEPGKLRPPRIPRLATRRPVGSSRPSREPGAPPRNPPTPANFSAPGPGEGASPCWSLSVLKAAPRGRRSSVGGAAAVHGGGRRDGGARWREARRRRGAGGGAWSRRGPAEHRSAGSQRHGSSHLSGRRDPWAGFLLLSPAPAARVRVRPDRRAPGCCGRVPPPPAVRASFHPAACGPAEGRTCQRKRRCRSGSPSKFRG